MTEEAFHATRWAIRFEHTTREAGLILAAVASFADDGLSAWVSPLEVADTTGAPSDVVASEMQGLVERGFVHRPGLHDGERELIVLGRGFGPFGRSFL